MTNARNPYYDAWERITGGGANWKFINWMNRRWMEIETEFQRSRRTIKPDEFLKWLDENYSLKN